ncbi:MAG: hypothetical protein HYY31_03085 [Chloroflexi bacterium]|nr:hypothetical protein [Chloroflexota bacterium]
MSQEVTAPRASREVRMLLQAAMILFIVTVVIGILNGLDLVEFNRPTLLTHVHAGTLGWITLCVFSAILWLFSDGQPHTKRRFSYTWWLSLLAIVAIAFYVLAFLLDNATARPITGGLVLLSILGVLIWVLARMRQVRLTVPHLAMLAALITLTLGAVLGVLLQIRLAGGATFLPEGAFGAHPSTMVTGYLILAGMAVAEWRLTPPDSRAALGWLGSSQVLLPFLGGMCLMVGVLLDIFPLIVPFQLLGVLIFLGRIGRRMVRIPWLRGDSERLFGLSAGFLAINVGIIGYLIGSYADRFEEIPSWLIFALDHSIFIGVMTNGFFGLVYEASRSRRSLWPWVDHVLFWGMNIGMVGFVVGLILQEPVLKRAFTPVMGTSILVAMAAYSARLHTLRKPSEAEGA